MDQDVILTSKQLYVVIINPEKLLYEGYAEAVTAISDKGKFDILPMHENFISLIKEKVIIYQKIGVKRLEFPIEKGVIKVQKNQIHVLTGFELLEDKKLVSSAM